MEGIENESDKLRNTFLYRSRNTLYSNSPGNRFSGNSFNIGKTSEETAGEGVWKEKTLMEK